MLHKSKIICVNCSTLFLPTGRAQKYCPECGPLLKKKVRNAWFDAKRRADGKKIGRGSVKGEQASCYKHGKSVFDRYARERKAELEQCEQCQVDLSKVSRWGWVGHHIDHNQMNNVSSNLKILCKRCHQIEHKCWENFFEGATTIPKGSRADNSPKRPTPRPGDDIV